MGNGRRCRDFWACPDNSACLLLGRRSVCSTVIRRRCALGDASPLMNHLTTSRDVRSHVSLFHWLGKEGDRWQSLSSSRSRQGTLLRPSLLGIGGCEQSCHLTCFVRRSPISATRLKLLRQAWVRNGTANSRSDILSTYKNMLITQNHHDLVPFTAALPARWSVLNWKDYFDPTFSKHTSWRLPDAQTLRHRLDRSRPTRGEPAGLEWVA